jgi:hypothetical protein
MLTKHSLCYIKFFYKIKIPLERKWNMPIKNRTESLELKILRILNTRMDLLTNEYKRFLNLDKGYEGEVKFDLFTEKIESEMFILNDLLLEVNNMKFQIDSLLISPITIYSCEVKNYEGDFYYQSDRLLYKKTGNERSNPLLQLERSESLLRQLLQKFGFPYTIESSVIFINPEFTLYQAPLNDSIIFPTQLNRFMKKLNRKSGKLNANHKKLADKLISAHIIESPYSRLPPYSYEQLRKGMTCSSCHSFSILVGEKKVVCTDCGCEEKIESAVLRSVEQIKLLFPDKKITTQCVHEWCQVIESKKMIRRILKQNFKAMGRNHFTYYI